MADLLSTVLFVLGCSTLTVIGVLAAWHLDKEAIKRAVKEAREELEKERK